MPNLVQTWISIILETKKRKTLRIIRRAVKRDENKKLGIETEKHNFFTYIFGLYNLYKVFVLVLFTAVRIIITLYNLLLLVVCSFGIASKFKLVEKESYGFLLHMSLMICHLQ